jgi:3-isopropylmalate dehydrogenase
MLLSAAMMLEWLADRHGDARLQDGAHLIERAVEQVFASGGVRPMEFGGPHGTHDITQAVLQALSGH